MSAPLTTSLMLAAMVGFAPLAVAASPEFARRYESALRVITETDPIRLRPKGADYTLAEFYKLLEAGSLQDIADASALTLRDIGKRPHWVAAMELASRLGPTFDRSKIVAAVRDNFTNFFVIDPVKGLDGQDPVVRHTAASLLCYHGSEADVQLVQQFIDMLRKIDPASAGSLQISVGSREQVLRLRKEYKGQTGTQPSKPAHVQTPESSVLKTRPPEAKTTQPTSENNNASTPLSVVVVLSVSATGLLWLLLKKRK